VAVSAAARLKFEKSNNKGILLGSRIYKKSLLGAENPLVSHKTEGSITAGRPSS